MDILEMKASKSRSSKIFGEALYQADRRYERVNGTELEQEETLMLM